MSIWCSLRSRSIKKCVQDPVLRGTSKYHKITPASAPTPGERRGEVAGECAAGHTDTARLRGAGGDFRAGWADRR